MLESTVEKYLIERAKLKGFELRKVKWIGRNDAPDRVAMKQGQTIWIEAKAPGQKPRPSQLREHARMEAAGQRVEVVDSFERIDEVLK